MDITYEMTVREMVAKYGRKVLDWKVVDVAVMAEAKQQQRADGLADTMTLTEFYVKCYKPEVSDAKTLADDTYRQREKALWYWEKLTGNPALRDIDKRVMNEFVKQMQEQSHLESRLVRRRSISTVVRCDPSWTMLAQKRRKTATRKSLSPCRQRFLPSACT